MNDKHLIITSAPPPSSVSLPDGAADLARVRATTVGAYVRRLWLEENPDGSYTVCITAYGKYTPIPGVRVGLRQDGDAITLVDYDNPETVYLELRGKVAAETRSVPEIEAEMERLGVNSISLQPVRTAVIWGEAR